MSEPYVQRGWTQFWAARQADGRWRIMGAIRIGMRYSEAPLLGSHSAAEALELLRRLRGTR